jgi:hypothetical protein
LKKEVAAAKAKEDAKKVAAEEKRTEALRNENLKRMQGMAGALGEENSKGTALKASGSICQLRRPNSRPHQTQHHFHRRCSRQPQGRSRSSHITRWHDHQPQTLV